MSGDQSTSDRSRRNVLKQAAKAATGAGALAAVGAGNASAYHAYPVMVNADSTPISTGGSCSPRYGSCDYCFSITSCDWINEIDRAYYHDCGIGYPDYQYCLGFPNNNECYKFTYTTLDGRRNGYVYHGHLSWGDYC